MRLKWKILALLAVVVIQVARVCGQSCKSIKTTNCYDLEGNRKKYDEKAYSCFADGLESRYCRCKYADESRQDMEAINSRMMCKSVKRFVGEEWFDKGTCQVKTCTVDEKVAIVRGGCRQETDAQEPEKYCVHIGAPRFPCIYEGKFYENCLCIKYDEENAIAKPVTCGTHDVGTTYVSNCNIVKCTASGQEEIITRRCQKADGDCVDSGAEHFPCFVHGLYRGSCSCEDGCVQQKQKKHRYRAQIDLDERYTLYPGTIYISLSGTVNESPAVPLIFRGFSAMREFETEFVGIPRKLIMQFLGKEVDFMNTGTDFKKVSLKDLESQTEYFYNESGQTGGDNFQYPKGSPHIRNPRWVEPSVMKVYEGVCKNKECDGTKPFGYHETYSLTFFCPFSGYENESMPVDNIKFVLSGEHLSTGYVDLLNEHLLETMNTAPPMYPVFTSKYVLPYCGKITHFSLYFGSYDLVWRGTCTIRVKVERRSQEFAFLYRKKPSVADYTLECRDSPHCGKKDWDLVCEGDKVAEWCQKDPCCSKKKLPCGRMCYIKRQKYKGKWNKATTGEKCVTPCETDRSAGVPVCKIETGELRQCDIPECRYQKCFGGHCYLAFERSEIRSQSKDFCFNEIGGRLAMIPAHVSGDVEILMAQLQKYVGNTDGYPRIFWLEGLGVQRSPVEWHKSRFMLPEPLQDMLITIDTGDLDLCVFHWNGLVFGGNCVRPGRPLCEVLM